MALTTDRMAEIADYCKVEADDTQLPSFLLTAAGILQEAGVSEPAAQDDGGRAQFGHVLRGGLRDARGRRRAQQAH